MARALTYLLAVLAATALLLSALASPAAGTAPSGSPARPSYHSDTDRDGIPDLFDFCPGLANVGLRDGDGDRLRDECDLDPENTGQLVIRQLPYLPQAHGVETPDMSGA